MKLLILGGTRFLGRHLVGAAQARGHEMSLFHRGQTNPRLYPELEHLQGNRDGDLEALRGRRWDAVIDTCGYVPRVVRASAELLAGAVEHYTFISSISVYPDEAPPGGDERAPVRIIADETSEDVPRDYGALKALCEQAVDLALPGRALSIRPGLIVGPHDPTERFTYWIGRVAEGGEILAPGRTERQIQLIDARDLADWVVGMAERRSVGVYNATGPDGVLTSAELLQACLAGTSDEARRPGGEARFTWVDEDFLLAHGVEPWTDLPLWLPETYNGMLAVSIDKALAAGLTFRPLVETVRDTWRWMQGGDELRPDRLASGARTQAGIDRRREAELLAAWHAQHGG